MQLNQGDNLTVLDITIIPSSNDFSLENTTITAYLLKPDNTIVEKNCIITDLTNRECQTILLAEDILLVGQYKLEVVVRGLDDLIISNPQKYSFEVVKSIRPLN